MPDAARITAIHFNQFKALGQHHLSLEHLNVLVGPNNSGKSTIIGSVRALAAALRIARSRPPERVTELGKGVLAHRIPEASLPISLENVHTDYAKTTSSVSFVLSNRNKLNLIFPQSGGCYLVPEARQTLTTPAQFKREFPITLAVVPVLGPVEHREVRRERDTVVASLATHRASRHFRSYWHHFDEHFDAFADLVRRTWPGMEIQRPEITDFRAAELSMFCLEDRITRELYWAGFGFQIWCQLLTHLCRAHEASLVVVDEPEVYLHPDVQRQLLAILRDIGPDVLLATHSTEIMAEAEPSDIVLVDKRRERLERLKDIAGVQRAIDAVGSIQNITLTSLARNRRVLFVEGEYDYKILRRFARKLGLGELASGFGITALASGGFGSWERITHLAEGIGQALGTHLAIAAVYDRDYFCDEEVAAVHDALTRQLRVAHVHARKEVENYLLVPRAIDQAVARAIADRATRSVAASPVPPTAADVLRGITDAMRDEVQAQLIARRTNYLRASRRDVADLTRETLAWFAPRWEQLDRRLHLVPGKQVLGALRARFQADVDVTLSDSRIIDAMHRDEIPDDLVGLLRAIDAFRISAT